MNVANTIKKLGLEQAFDYLYKDPENNLLKLMNWADKFSDGDKSESPFFAAHLALVNFHEKC